MMEEGHWVVGGGSFLEVNRKRNVSRDMWRVVCRSPRVRVLFVQER